MYKDDVFNTREGFPIPPEHIPSHQDIRLVQSGDMEARQRLIEGLMEFVVEAADWFCRVSHIAKPFREDLISVGFVTLVDMVDTKINNIPYPLGVLTYLQAALRGAFQRWFGEQAPTVRIPQSTRHDNKQPIPKKHSVEDRAGPSTLGEVEFNDFVKALPEIEQTIIEGLIQGLTQREIKKHLEKVYPDVAIGVDERIARIRDYFKRHYQLCKGE